MPDDIDVILFDLGGVLVELGPSPVPAHALGEDRQYPLSAWFKSASAIAFETGEIGVDEFAQALIDELGLTCGADELIDHFSAWPLGLYPGAASLLQNLKPHYRLAVLSNTNELHWPRFTGEFGLGQLVDEMFASHRLGLAKPGEAIFTEVSAALAAAPASILFLDDNEPNVASAARLGFAARCVQGVAGIEQALAEFGISVDFPPRGDFSH